MSSGYVNGLVVRLEAKSGMEDELSEFLKGAGELVLAEPETPIWLGMRTSKTTFWIVDAFVTEEGRNAHFSGEVTKALGANSERLLASAPVVMKAEVLASKVFS